MNISIYENGTWAGNGELIDGVVENCSAVLGDDQEMADSAYHAISAAIEAGESIATIGAYTWTWEIETFALDEDEFRAWFDEHAKPDLIYATTRDEAIESLEQDHAMGNNPLSYELSGWFTKSGNPEIYTQ